MKVENAYSLKSIGRIENIRGAVASLSEIEGYLGKTFCDDLTLPNQAFDEATLRRFLSSVAIDEDPTLERLRSFWTEQTWKQYNSQEAAISVANAIVRFLDLYQANFRESWRRRAQSVLAEAMRILGEHNSGRYPKFNSKMLPTIKSVTRPARSLGTLEWPELCGLHPSERDEAALNLARQAAVAAFERAESIFLFGQSVLTSAAPPAHVKPEAWLKVKAALTSARTELERTGRSTHTHGYSDLNRADEWFFAGMPKRCLLKPYMEALTVHELALSCLGPTNNTSMAVKVIFCIETAWNREQIDQLPSDPYAFRSEGIAGVGETAFLTAYKARAHHLVSAFMERGYRNFRLGHEQLLSIWADEAREQEQITSSQLIEDTSTLAIMDRYSVLTEQVRPLDAANVFSERFFVSLGRSVGSESIDLRRANLGEMLCREGVNFRTLRQTGINVQRRKTGSLANTRHFSNNSGTSVLVTHYDDEVQQHDLDQGIRFWQNCIQTHIAERCRSVAFRLMLPQKNLEWFSQLARLAGISASIAIKGRELHVVTREFLEFIPSAENFADLYLIRRALLAARNRLGGGRWTIQAVPLLSFIKAIRRHAFENGLGSNYIAACRKTFNELKIGACRVPCIFPI